MDHIGEHAVHTRSTDILDLCKDGFEGILIEEVVRMKLDGVKRSIVVRAFHHQLGLYLDMNILNNVEKALAEQKTSVVETSSTSPTAQLKLNCTIASLAF